MMLISWARLCCIGNLFLICSLLLTSQFAFATQMDDKFWSSSTLNGSYGSYLYYIEPQARLIVADNPYNQFLINAGNGYKVSPSWELWLGGTTSTMSQDALSSDLEEYRIWEQVIWKKKIYSLSLISRTRIEQRKSVDFTEWSTRARERILFNIPLVSNLSLALSDEIMVNLNQVEWIFTKTWDQNRAYIGIVQKLSKNTFLSAGYMNQYIFTNQPQISNVLVVNFQVNLMT